MDITMRPMSLDEAWQHILWQYQSYQDELKQFNYPYLMFIPTSLAEMFEKTNLTKQDIDKYHTIFMSVYESNTEKLHRFDDVFESYVKPMLLRAIDKFLVPILPSWNAVLPKQLNILCTFGNSAGYSRQSDDIATIHFRMTRFQDNQDHILDVFFHEFVHSLIEFPIIRKYNVPQDLKERIVDLICFEFIQKPVQKSFENSFANDYINSDVIKTNLSRAVQTMMKDYNKKH